MLAAMPEATPRPSARVLLVDDQERILLYRGLSPTKNPDYAWFTPGGGVQKGEALSVAASRELREETGYEAAPDAFGPVVAFSSGLWRHSDGTLFRADDSFFLLRVPAFDIDISGMEDFELSLLDTHHWWPLPDLDTTNERVIPLHLATLVRRLLSDGIPREPIALPWHRTDAGDH